MNENIYTIFWIVIIILWILYKALLRQNKKAITIILTLHFGALVSLRNATYVGVDIVRYVRHYNIVKELPILESFLYNDDSWGYYFSNALFGKMGCSFQMYISIVSFFVLLFLGGMCISTQKNQ